MTFYASRLGIRKGVITKKMDYRNLRSFNVMKTQKKAFYRPLSFCKLGSCTSFALRVVREAKGNREKKNVHAGEFKLLTSRRLDILENTGISLNDAYLVRKLKS